MENLKDPNLKFKYAAGLGDIIACILHSKALGWLTKLITGKDKPCGACDKRSKALNILFPFRFWRLFFKTNKEMMDSLVEELEAGGYVVAADTEKGSLLSVRVENKRNPNAIDPPTYPANHDMDKYFIISDSENKVENLLIKTLIYKSKP